MIHLLFECWFHSFILCFRHSLILHKLLDHVCIGIWRAWILWAVHGWLLAQWIVVKQGLHHIKFNVKMIKRIECTKILHADDLASNVLGELEVYSHFAALGQRAILPQKHYIEHFFHLIECNLILNLLSFQLNQIIYLL